MDLTKKKHISFSEYRLWNQCSFKHFLTKQLGYSEPTNEFLVFGTAVHAALEEIALKKHSKVFYSKIMEKALEAEAKGITLVPTFKKKLANQGHAILKEVDFQERFKEYDVIGCEQEIYEPLYTDEKGDIVYFKGIIDLVLKKKDTDEYIILDYKTAMKSWDIEKKKEDKTFFCQLALYKHFFSKINQVPLEKIQTRFVVLVRDPASVETVDITLTDEFMVFTMMDIIRTIKEIIVSNKDNVVKAKCSPETKENCKYCFFHKNKTCNDQAKQEVQPYVKQIVNNE